MILVDPLAHPIIAHRGASGRCPENTLLAFHQALEQRADAVEFDVRLTGDGALVVMHDATVDRTTDGTGVVGEMPLEAVLELDAGEGESVPTLEQALEATEGVPVIVEIKDPAAGQSVADTLLGAGARERVLVGSFESAPLGPVRRAGIPTTPSRREATRFWLASRVGWPRLGCGYQALSVPEYQGRLRVVDRRFLCHATRGGRPVHVWTVDEAETARRLRSLGVAGILTNFPERMRGLGFDVGSEP
jgi:glycerophosphoryl diester phosphodiesterase